MEMRRRMCGNCNKTRATRVMYCTWQHKWGVQWMEMRLCARCLAGMVSAMSEMGQIRVGSWEQLPLLLQGIVPHTPGAGERVVT